MWAGTGTYHHCCSCSSCLCCYCSLVGLMLCSFDFGLQMCRRVKIFAFLPHAATLNVIHTNGYSVIICINHRAVCWVSKAAISLSPCTVSSLKLPAYLRKTHKDTSLKVCLETGYIYIDIVLLHTANVSLNPPFKKGFKESIDVFLKPI